MRLKLFVALVLFLAFARPALAVSDPDFPSCPAPGGSILAHYSAGIHGIPGDSSVHTGSDSVFSLNDTQVVQCFCDPAGAGIQSNWWKQSSLDGDQFNQLINSGWTLVPDGSAWGLASAPYLVKNLNFSCSGSSSPPGSSSVSAGPAPVCDSAKPAAPTNLTVHRQGDKAVLTWNPASRATTYTIGYGVSPGNYIYGVPDTGNVTTFTIGALDPGTVYYFAVRGVNNCMPGDWNTQGTGQVLGLAATGNLAAIYSVLGLGIVLLILSFLAHRHRRET